MKKTATLLALAGLSMAAKPDHLHNSFLGRKTVDHTSTIDPNMVIRPHHDIDPGMVIKPKHNVDPKMIIKPTRKPQGTIAADDDELLLVWRPQYDLDPGMVRRPPMGGDIDPKMVKKPPMGDIDRGIFVRPRPQGPVWVDDELRVVYGDNVDPGMVIKPRSGDIDPGMVRRPNRGYEIDPKMIIKPRKSDFLFADDDELVYAGNHIDSGMIKRPTNGGIDQGIYVKPKGNVKYLDDELVMIDEDQSADLRREQRLMGDFYTKPWPNHAVHADDELIVDSKESRLIGDFYPQPWYGQPVYADDDELALNPSHIDAGVPSVINRRREPKNMGIPHSPTRSFPKSHIDVGMPRSLGHYANLAVKPTVQAADDELALNPSHIDGEAPSVINRRREPKNMGIPSSSIRSFPSSHIDVGMPRSLGHYAATAVKPRVYAVDDELVYAGEKASGVAVADQTIIVIVKTKTHDDADDELSFGRPTRGTVAVADQGIPIKPISHDDKVKAMPEGKVSVSDQGVPVPVKSKAADDELILFADQSLDIGQENRPRRGVFDIKTLTKPWYQQTMYADDELASHGEKTHKATRNPVHVDDELILFADQSLDMGMEPRPRRGIFDPKTLTKPWSVQTMYADDSLVALGELLEDN